MDFCVSLDEDCERYGIDPWTYFVEEPLGHLKWTVRRTVRVVAAMWRHEREQAARADDVEAAPRPRSGVELQEERVRQANAFEQMAAVVEGR